ncbi:MAG TPA: adenylate/guanylate cyclase domain-containing protein [Candidatus Binatia bacterium]|nr:adenylate/guanylate cyclase domain-containing protein [Candidatus Binatia bacterium]
MSTTAVELLRFKVAEDDAIRAVRAGVSTWDAFRSLRASNTTAFVDVGLRIGINSGEVIVSADNTEVVGDPANVAARLQQEARDGDVIIGEPTRRLVQESVTPEPLPVLHGASPRPLEIRPSHTRAAPGEKRGIVEQVRGRCRGQHVKIPEDVCFLLRQEEIPEASRQVRPAGRERYPGKEWRVLWSRLNACEPPCHAVRMARIRCGFETIARCWATRDGPA